MDAHIKAFFKGHPIDQREWPSGPWRQRVPDLNRQLLLVAQWNSHELTSRGASIHREAHAAKRCFSRENRDGPVGCSGLPTGPCAVCG